MQWNRDGCGSTTTVAYILPPTILGGTYRCDGLFMERRHEYLVTQWPCIKYVCGLNHATSARWVGNDYYLQKDYEGNVTVYVHYHNDVKLYQFNHLGLEGTTCLRPGSKCFIYMTENRGQLPSAHAVGSVFGDRADGLGFPRLCWRKSHLAFMKNSATKLRLDAQVVKERYHAETLSERKLLYSDGNTTSLYLSLPAATQSSYRTESLPCVMGRSELLGISHTRNCRIIPLGSPMFTTPDSPNISIYRWLLCLNLGMKILPQGTASGNTFTRYCRVGTKMAWDLVCMSQYTPMKRSED